MSVGSGGCFTRETEVMALGSGSSELLNFMRVEVDSGLGLARSTPRKACLTPSESLICALPLTQEESNKSSNESNVEMVEWNTRV